MNGKGVIAATAVDVRYAEPFWQREWQHSEFPEAAHATPPAKTLPAATGNGAVEEVWVLVRVPAAATAGDYTGTLAIAAGGQKLADAPLRLHVADWKLPDPKDFHTFVGLYQSPDTLAMKYKVPQWSEKHWALLEKSMDLLGQLGNKLVHVNVVDKTKWGNDDGMVTWIKKDDGSFDYDYSVVERYLRTVRKHMGVPRFVVLNVYNPGGWMPAKPLQENTVTVLDRKTGQASTSRCRNSARKRVRSFGRRCPSGSKSGWPRKEWRSRCAWAACAKPCRDRPRPRCSPRFSATTCNGSGKATRVTAT